MADKPEQLHLTGIPLRSIPADEQPSNSGKQGFHPVLIEQIEHGVLNALLTLYAKSRQENAPAHILKALK